MKKLSFKEEKFFRPADIVLYVAIILIIVGIALWVFLPKNGNITESKIYYGEKEIYCYSFVTKQGLITSQGKEYVTEREENGVLFVTVFTEKGKNVIEIGSDYIKMSEADCSRHPDCVEKFSPLTKGNGTIVCLPHEIKILSFGDTNEVKL